jgi:hypothetical protein
MLLHKFFYYQNNKYKFDNGERGEEIKGGKEIKVFSNTKKSEKAEELKEIIINNDYPRIPAFSEAEDTGSN